MKSAIRFLMCWLVGALAAAGMAPVMGHTHTLSGVVANLFGIPLLVAFAIRIMLLEPKTLDGEVVTFATTDIMLTGFFRPTNPAGSLGVEALAVLDCQALKSATNLRHSLREGLPLPNGEDAPNI